MTGTTPQYGIRYPDSATKLRALGSELATAFADVERVLLAAKVPAVTPAPVMVAASATARNSYWGTPGTEAARRALQDRGATTIRLDTGDTERYFATYNATTNPAGATTPGWYPVMGSYHGSDLVRTSGVFTITATRTPLSWTGAEGASGFWSSTNPTRVTIPRSGVYDIRYAFRGEGSNREIEGQMQLNGSILLPRSMSSGGDAADGAYPLATRAVNLRLTAGDYLSLIVMSYSGNVQLRNADTIFQIRLIN